MDKKAGAIARFDNTGHFEIVDDQLITELGPQDAALVSGGATLTDRICGQDIGCVGGPNGPNVNVFCDTDGHKQLLTHGNHTLNVVC